jgi:hypothetical protein
VRECLLQQLDRRPDAGPIIELVRRIVAEHLELLGKGSTGRSRVSLALTAPMSSRFGILEVSASALPCACRRARNAGTAASAGHRDPRD